MRSISATPPFRIHITNRFKKIGFNEIMMRRYKAQKITIPAIIIHLYIVSHLSGGKVDLLTESYKIIHKYVCRHAITDY
jgi:hypothetical protein